MWMPYVYPINETEVIWQDIALSLLCELVAVYLVPFFLLVYVI